MLNLSNSSPTQSIRTQSIAQEDQKLYNDVSVLNEREKYKASPYRWAILVLFTGMVFNYNSILAAFTSLVDPVVIGFGVK